MKNLFSIDKTNDKGITDFNENPYLKKRVSDETRQKLANAFTVLEEGMAPPPNTEEYTALRRKENRYWLFSLICFAAGVAMVFIGGELKWFETSSYLLIPVLVLMLGSLALCVLAKSTKSKREGLDRARRQIDFDEATKDLEAASSEAARELGVPEKPLTADILPFHYIDRNGKPVSLYKKDYYDNLSVVFFLCEDGLHVATAKELFVIPADQITGYRIYDRDYEIDMWLKSENADSDAYAPFNFRRSGLFGLKSRGYYGIVIRGEEEYEILIPNYDFEPVRSLLRLNLLAE